MKKIVIIGGGVAGLSAGIYARLNGLDAAVYEMNASPGGNLSAWERGGYRIDNCIHWLTGTNPATETYKMWRELGALDGGEVIQTGRLYTCEYGGWRLSLCCDLEKLRRDMLDLSPADRREIERLIRAVKVMQGMSGIAGKRHDQKLGAARMAASAPLLLRYLRMTAGELSARFYHPLIRKFLSGLLTGDFGAIALLEVFSCFTGHNGGIPRGGSEAMARRMAQRFASLGGSLYTGKRAVSLRREGGRIVSAVFSDGAEVKGDCFVVTADPATVFGVMTDLPMPRRLARLYANPRLRRFSAVQCAFSCDAPKPPFTGDLVMPLGRSARGEFGSDLIILREYSHEPEYAPAGKSLIQTMVFVGENKAREYLAAREDPTAYAEKKRIAAAAAESAIIFRFPVLSGKLSCIDVWTPATYRRYTASEIGSFMSFAFTSRYLPVPVKNKVDGVGNLYLAGQWLQPPGGLPIAAESGRRAICEILKAQ